MPDGLDAAVDVAIAKVARRQHGNITRGQLHALGLGECAIAYRVKKGRMYRVFRGVYAVGKPAVTPLERAAAAVLACGPRGVLSHFSALAVWGFAKKWPQEAEVTIVGDRRPLGIVVHLHPQRAPTRCPVSTGDPRDQPGENDARLRPAPDGDNEDQDRG